MGNSCELVSGNEMTKILSHSLPLPCSEASSLWLDVKIFYVRVSECEINDFPPDYLTLNHIPLNPHTLLEVNGLRSSINYDGAVLTHLRRDRLDKKSEEAMFVTTDSMRMTGSLQFEVFVKDVLMLSGVLDLRARNGFNGETKCCGQGWSMKCGSNLIADSGVLKGKYYMGPGSTSPRIEVYVAGCFLDTPIILTKTLHLNFRREKMRNKHGLGCIPEFEISEYPNYKLEDERYNELYSGAEYLESEDGELSLFNARV